MYFQNGSLKLKITVITIVFSLIIALVIASASFLWYRSSVRQNMVQAAEFNLQLVEGIIDPKLSSVQMLARWCSTNRQVSSYFGSETDGNSSSANAGGTDNQYRLEAFDRVREQMQSSDAAFYMNRVLIVGNGEKHIQTGSRMTQSLPITAENLGALSSYNNGEPCWFESIIQDPLSFEGDYVILLCQPVLHLYTKERVGTIYIAVSTGLFTDPLQSYYIQPDSSIFLTLGNNSYIISGAGNAAANSNFSHADIDFSNTELLNVATINAKTKVGRVNIGGKSHTYVQYPFTADGIYLTQILSASQDAEQMRLFFKIAVFMAFLLVLFALVLRSFMNRLVGIPVNKLTKRMKTISEGDFTYDPDIEWQNEFGVLGKGINNMSQNIKELMSKTVENEKMKREIEFKMLQNQINPHFMYNTLNSIRWMATIQNAPGIAEMVTSFASLLRNISNRNDEMFTLRQELSFLEDYFTVQKYRYGGSVSMTVEKCDESLLDANIPRFTLQPLIENAIFHGIEPKGNAGIIQISITSDYASKIDIIVRDDGIGIPAEKLGTILSDDANSGKGLFKQVGLANVHKRLQLVFGEDYGLSVESSAGEYTVVTVRIPYTKVSADAASSDAQDAPASVDSATGAENSPPSTDATPETQAGESAK